MLFHRNTMPIKDKATLENLQAENAKLQAEVEYLAMMADIDFGEENEDVVSEN